MKMCNGILRIRNQSALAKILRKAYAFLLVVVVFAPAIAMAGEKKSKQKPGAETTTAVLSSADSQSGIKSKPVSDSTGKSQAPDNSTSHQTDDSKSPGDYKKSLEELSSLYELDAKRLAQENDQLKGLYADGLIARVELEGSDRSLAEAQAKLNEAQAKVEAVRKQIADASIKPETLQSVQAAGPSNQVWSTGSNKIDNLIRYYGNEAGVDPYLIFCLMSQESSFATRATSPKGAQGLMQLMPATAARYGVTNPYDSAQSIMGGARYLKDLLQLLGGRLDLALAGYNAGENAVIKYGYNIPPYAETKAYVRLISARYAQGNRAVSTRA